MEQLSVKGFLVIKEAEFEISDVNVIIGTQASGKSVLAKLLYFFREFLDSSLRESIVNDLVKNEIVANGIKTFESYFPKYTWNDQSFHIRYTSGEYVVTIDKDGVRNKGRGIKLNYSNPLSDLHKKLKIAHKKRQKQTDEDEMLANRHPYRAPWEVLEELVYKQDIGPHFGTSLFIPASRSFFANLQKNVFSFLASNIEIDIFMKEFGSRYEMSKRYYGREPIKKKGGTFQKKIDTLMEQVLVGHYSYEDEQDWIENEGRKVSLSNASSGQQEALPMLVVLTSGLLFWKETALFIEEPEAHLFPTSQKYIVQLLALIRYHRRNRIVMTTHSPYILTALNNLVLAGDVANLKGVESVKKIVDPDLCLNFGEVRAYTIRDGVLESILDNENRLIGASVIDSVSDEFSQEYDSLLKLQYSGSAK